MEDIKEVVNENKVDNEEINQQQIESNLNHLKDLINNDIECKGYIDSLIDSQVNKRLEKRLTKELEKAEKEKQIKAEEEKRVSEEQQKIKDYERKITMLENTIKYKSIIEKSGLNTELIDFLANGTTTEEEVIKNIDRFKELLREEVRREISKKWINNPIPENSEGEKSNKKNKLWNI